MAENTRTGGREATQAVIPGRVALSVGRPNLAEPSGFEWRKLTDIARLESGHTPSRSKDEYWSGDIPWIGIRDATGNHGRVINKTSDCITQAGLENSSARLLPAGTVCLSRTASVGFVVEMGRPMATSQDFVNWVCGPELNGRYLRYVLMLEQDSIRRFSHGTTHQTMYYPEAKALHVLTPRRSTQDAIVEVLGALDDKIAANDRIADAAQNLADALFMASFQQGVGTPITMGVLADRGILALGDGYRTKRAEHGKPGFRILRAGDVRDGYIMPEGADFVSDVYSRQIGPKVSQPGDVILTTKGSVGRVAVVPPDLEAVVYSPQICYFRVLDEERLDGSYLAAWFRSPSFQAQASRLMFKSDMAPYINLRDIRSLVIPLLSRNEQGARGDLQRNLLVIFHAAHAENMRLGRTRDELLPLLMSGEVRVCDAEKVVEGVV